MSPSHLRSRNSAVPSHHANVYDDDQVEAVFLNLTTPDTVTAPVPLLFNATSGLYEATIPADQLGQHTFTIEAVDRIGKMTAYEGNYEVLDTTPPSIEDFTAHPDPQEFGGDINATANVTDLGGTASVTLEVTAESGTLILNRSMDITSAHEYYLNSTYAQLGNLTFTLWTSDPTGNWATAKVTVLMEDTVLPAIQHIPVEEAALGETIHISAAVTDAGSGVQTVTLYHRGVGEPGFEAIPLVKNASTGLYEGNIPAQVATGTLYYYIEAVDSAGNAVAHPAAGAAAPHELLVTVPPEAFPWWWLPILLLTAIFIAGIVLARRRRKEEARAPEPTVFLETTEEPTVCGICLGAIKAGLTVARCATCGKVFHDSCASRVASCPSCESEIRMEEAVAVDEDEANTFDE